MERLSIIRISGLLLTLLFPAAIYLSSCGGGGSTASAPPPLTYSISGAVSFPGNDNLDGTVHVCRSPNNDFSNSCGTIEGGGSSGVWTAADTATGSYTFSGLPNGGTYYIAAFMDVNGNDTFDNPSEPLGIYGSSADYDDYAHAASVMISGANATAIDVGLLRSLQAITHSISGTVTYSGTTSGQMLVAASPDQGFSIYSSKAIANPDGTYELTDLPDGIYFIGAAVDVDGDALHDANLEPIGIYHVAAYYDTANAAPVDIVGIGVLGIDFEILDPPADGNVIVR